MSTNRITHLAFLLIISFFFLMGCGGEETAVTESAELAAVEPTATIRPTNTVTLSPTLTPTATNTATSTNTPTPTSTFTPTPTNTPEPTDTPQPTDTATPTNTPRPDPTLPPTLPPPPPTSAPTEPPPPPAYGTWKNIPIMPGAHDAFEDAGGSYWYLVDTSGAGVRQFYTQTIGWDVLIDTGDDNFGSIWIGKGACQTVVTYEYLDGATGVMILAGCP